METKVYPHLFRNMKVIEYRRGGVHPDTVMNSMGWKDKSQYDRRYGKRGPLETLEEARRITEGGRRLENVRQNRME